MIEKKGLGDKKINRVGVSLSNEYSFKLNRLAVACGVKHTTLAGMILEKCLDDPDFVNTIQNDHCLYAAYRIRAVKNYTKDRIDYVLYNGNERDDF